MNESAALCLLALAEKTAKFAQEWQRFCIFFSSKFAPQKTINQSLAPARPLSPWRKSESERKTNKLTNGRADANAAAAQRSCAISALPTPGNSAPRESNELMALSSSGWPLVSHSDEARFRRRRGMRASPEQLSAALTAH